jgi:hypothetical protein
LYRKFSSQIVAIEQAAIAGKQIPDHMVLIGLGTLKSMLAWLGNFYSHIRHRILVDKPLLDP